MYKQYLPTLIKAYNEQYFRHYDDTIMYSISKNYTIDDIISLMNCAEEVKADEETYYLVKDICTIMIGNEPHYTGYSEVMCDIASTLSIYSKRFFHLSVPNDVAEVLKSSQNSYMVGGCVRDTLLHKNPKDFDFVTDIPYDDMQVMFEKAGFTVKETGKQFLVMIVSKDGNDYEIANFRKDGNYADGRRPEAVEIGDIYDDCNRRDFTVNALYYNINTRELVDPTGQGVDDIKSKTLRFIGKAEDRIREDFLRVFRFYRFVSRGFTPEPKSLSAARRLFDEAVQKTAGERIKNEIEKNGTVRL